MSASALPAIRKAPLFKVSSSPVLLRFLQEDQDRRAVFAFVCHFINGVHIALAAVNGHRAHAAQKPADQRIFEQLLLGQDGIALPAEHRFQNIDRVQVRKVVGCDNMGAPAGMFSLPTTSMRHKICSSGQTIGSRIQ